MLDEVPIHPRHSEFHCSNPFLEGVLNAYTADLRHHRGLVDSTIKIYRHYLTPFLQSLDGKDILASLSEVSPQQVLAFFAKQSRGKADTTRGQIQATLRTFFSFCARQGYVVGHLTDAVPKVFRYRLANVPRHICEQSAQKLLESIDRSTSAGQRDYAIVLLLHTYGVRGAQIHSLRLEDIQWRQSRIRFRSCKGGKEIPDQYLTSLIHLNPNTRANRLSVVRQFCMYMRQFAPQCYVPEPTARTGQKLSRTPYIFTDNEIKALLVAARHLSPPGSLRPMTFYTLFGLLYTTGLRVGESIALNLADVDLARQRPFVHQGKFRKSRWIPMSASTCSALQRYIQERTRVSFRPRHKIPSSPTSRADASSSKLFTWPTAKP